MAVVAAAAVGRRPRTASARDLNHRRASEFKGAILRAAVVNNQRSSVLVGGGSAGRWLCSRVQRRALARPFVHGRRCCARKPVCACKNQISTVGWPARALPDCDDHNLIVCAGRPASQPSLQHTTCDRWPKTLVSWQRARRSHQAAGEGPRASVKQHRRLAE
jgi:hypothetical protein